MWVVFGARAIARWCRLRMRVVRSARAAVGTGLGLGGKTEPGRGQVVVTKRKPDDAYPPARHVMPLKTPKNVLKEMCRIYRAGLNGKILPEDMTRFIYVLKEIRAAVENEVERTAEQAEVAEFNTTIVVHTAEHGAFLSPYGQLVDAQTADELWALERAGRLPPPGTSPPQLKVIDHQDDPEPPAAA